MMDSFALTKIASVKEQEKRRDKIIRVILLARLACLRSVGSCSSSTLLSVISFSPHPTMYFDDYESDNFHTYVRSKTTARAMICVVCKMDKGRMR